MKPPNIREIGLHPRILKLAYPYLTNERIALGLGRSVRQIARYCSPKSPTQPPNIVLMQTYSFYERLKANGIEPEHEGVIENNLTEMIF